MTSEGGPISAEVLNAAMEWLGLADLQFEAVQGRPVLRRTSDEVTLEYFIGLLLTGIGAVYLQHVEVEKQVAELDDQLAALQPQQPEVAERIASTIAKLRQILGERVLTRHRAVQPKLTIGPLDADEDAR